MRGVGDFFSVAYEIPGSGRRRLSRRPPAVGSQRSGLRLTNIFRIKVDSSGHGRLTARVGEKSRTAASRPAFTFANDCPLELLGISYCTITVTVVLWLRLPDLAVTLAVYVPAGVPAAFIEDDPPPPPPHAASPNNTTTIIGIARAGIRRR